ncbi:MAG: helix-turn-helix domain-containing protein [Candidatus Micrarchaeota archaeon]
MEKNILSKLERLGLTRNESKVYLALLEIGPTTTKAIIERTRVHTSKVYESLERLIGKGLANFVVEANRKKFQATDPESIIGFLEDRQADIEDEKNLVRDMLPELRSVGIPSIQQSATVFSGLKGFKAMLNNMLKEIGHNGNYDAFASSKLREEVGPYWLHFQMKKKKMGIKSRCIWDEKIRSQRDYLKEYFGKGRFVPEGSFNSPADVFIYADKVLLVSYASEPIFAVLIQSEGMAKGYRELFNTLWNISKK